MKKHLCLIIAALALFYTHTSASACGFLDRSEPEVGEVLHHTPEKVTVWLTEPLDRSKSSIEVRDAEGALVSIGTPRADQGNDKSISIALKPLPQGDYKVKWQMTAQECNHISTGTFPFTVDK